MEAFEMLIIIFTVTILSVIGEYLSLKYVYGNYIKDNIETFFFSSFFSSILLIFLFYTIEMPSVEIVINIFSFNFGWALGQLLYYWKNTGDIKL